MTETRLKRIGFRAWRRGFREADLILGPFSDQYCPSMTTEELDQFEALLDQLDYDIYDWVADRRPVPPEFDTPVFKRLQIFQRNLPVAGGDLSGS
jgi:antitoxin CptB